VLSSDLIRWGGLAAMLAGGTFIVLMLIPEGPPGSFLYTLNSLVFIVAVLLMLAGAGGVPRPAEGEPWAHRTRRLLHGRRGRGSPDRSPGRPHVWEHGPRISRLFGLLGVMVGLVLYGAATLQARVLPRWCGVHRRLTGMVGRIGSLGKRIWRIAWGDDIRVTVAGARLCALVGKGHSNRGTITTCALGNPVAF
jgi:hypothetical protein